MNRRLRALAAVLLIAALLLSCCAKKPEKASPDVGFLADGSSFLDYTIRDGRVEIRCVLTLVNRGKEACSLRVFGDFPSDQGTLLKEERLTAVDAETGSDTFALAPGEIREVGVWFTGTYAGKAIKNSRVLPSLSWEDAENPGSVQPLQAYIRETKRN